MAAEDLFQVVNYFHILMIMAIVVDDKYGWSRWEWL